jgi:hypothetical protein
MPSNPTPALQDLAILQDDVLTRQQLYECGYTESAIRAGIKVQRWQAFGRRVVVLHNGPLTARQQWWVAVLAQHRAALAGFTAATEHGLTGFDDGRIHLLVEFGARRHPMPGVRIHVSRRFSVDDIHPAHSLPTVRVERALVDAASWTPQERKACAVLASGVQQRLTTAERLKPELAAAAGARHHRLLTRVLWDIEGGAQSFAEIDVGRCAALAGLPPPIRQAFRYDRAGRRRWLDADFKGFSLEIDGAVHLKPLRYWDDMERQNDLVIVTGKPIFRFSTVAFRTARDVVIAQLAAAGQRFGC